MRKKDREIHDVNELREILRKADVARIAFSTDGAPYIVAMNYGFEWGQVLRLYFHCAKEGRKINLMEKNRLVCFQMDTDHELVRGANICKWSMNFRSIVGLGILKRVEDEEEKKKGLGLIMNHYGYEGEQLYDEKVFAATEVLRLEVTELVGKKKS
jgi:hypothetical protein